MEQIPFHTLTLSQQPQEQQHHNMTEHRCSRDCNCGAVAATATATATARAGKMYQEVIDKLTRRQRRRVVLITWICKIFLGTLLVLGLGMLLVWLTLQPRKPRFYVEEAQAQRFHVSAANATVTAALRLVLRLRNPNRHVAVRFDDVDAYVMYDDVRFAGARIPAFESPRRNTRYLRPLFTAHAGAGAPLPADVAARMADEAAAEAAVAVRVKMYTRVHFHVGRWSSPTYHVRVKCYDLFVGVTPGSVTAFNDKRCGTEF